MLKNKIFSGSRSKILIFSLALAIMVPLISGFMVFSLENNQQEGLDSDAYSASKLEKAALAEGLIETAIVFEQENVTETGFKYLSQIPLSEGVQEYIYDRAVENDIDYPTVLALIWRESRFQTNAIGYNSNGTTDSGLMQINDVNREWLRANHGIENLIDAEDNVRGGLAMLGMFVEKHGLHDGLLAYQWGEGGMLSKKRNGITTSRELEKLYEKRAEFEEVLGLCPTPPTF